MNKKVFLVLLVIVIALSVFLGFQTEKIGESKNFYLILNDETSTRVFFATTNHNTLDGALEELKSKKIISNYKEEGGFADIIDNMANNFAKKTSISLYTDLKAPKFSDPTAPSIKHNDITLKLSNYGVKEIPIVDGAIYYVGYFHW